MPVNHDLVNVLTITCTQYTIPAVTLTSVSLALELNWIDKDWIESAQNIRVGTFCRWFDPTLFRRTDKGNAKNRREAMKF